MTTKKTSSRRLRRKPVKRLTAKAKTATARKTAAARKPAAKKAAKKAVKRTFGKAIKAAAPASGRRRTGSQSGAGDPGVMALAGVAAPSARSRARRRKSTLQKPKGLRPPRILIDTNDPLQVASPNAALVQSNRVPNAVQMSEVLRRHIDASPALSNAANELMERVTFQVSARTVSGVVLRHIRGRMHEYDLAGLRLDTDVAATAAAALQARGIRVERIGRFGITCSAPVALLSDMLKTKFQLFANPRPSPIRSLSGFAVSDGAPTSAELSLVPERSITLDPKLSSDIDHFTFYPAPIYFGAGASVSATGPTPSWHHLSGPKLRALLKVPEGGDAPTGAGVKLAMIDTGFYEHPFFKAYKYHPVTTSTGAAAEKDTSGHGTAMAWNAVQVAPGIDFMGFKQSKVPSDALEEAASRDAHIISCSWGWEKEQQFPLLEATIRDLISEGRILLFASGNGQHAWPGSMPEIISVGGVYADVRGKLEASNYASGYMSSVYSSRQVPDVCGLVGQLPRAIYLMLPCPPGSEMDVQYAGGSFPDGDETAASDGWVGASGTSAATPQVAGVVALMVEKARRKRKKLSPENVKKLLQNSAAVVASGLNAQRLPATAAKPNPAVGYGLVDAGSALALV